MSIRKFVVYALLAGGGVMVPLLVASSAPGASGTAPKFKPSSWDVVFDFVKVGTVSGAQSLTVTNAGGGPETFSSLQIVGRNPNDFSIGSDGCTGHTLATNDHCDVTLQFAPKAAGTRVAQLRFNDNTSCPDWINLAGSGTTTMMTRARAASCVVVTKSVGGGTQTGPTVTQTQTNTLTVTNAPSGVPCTSKRQLKFSVNAPKGKTFKSLSATIAKRKLQVIKGKHKGIVKVDLRGLPRARYLLKVSGQLSPSGSLSRQKHYVTCTPGKSPS